MNSSINQKTKNPFDSWKSIVTALYMTLIGYGVLVGIPVISTAWVNLLGFSEEQIGRIVSMDLGGMTAGAILTSFIIKRLNRKIIVIAGILIAVLANLGCVLYQGYNDMLLLRFIAGIGSGIYTAVAVATLGGGSKPELLYSFMMLAFAFSQAAEIHFLPSLTINGIYYLFALCYLITLPLLIWLPSRPYLKEHNHSLEQHEEDKTLAKKSVTAPKNMSWICIIAILFTYINIGGYWTYIELAGIRAGIEEEYINRVLFWVSFGTIIGCLLAMVLSRKHGYSLPLLSSLGLMIIITALVGFHINYITLLISLLFFNLLWVFIDVYQMATIAIIDRSGIFASLLPAGQGLGQVLGPNIAASIIGYGLDYSWVFYTCALAVFIGFVLYFIVFTKLGNSIPAFSRLAKNK